MLPVELYYRFLKTWPREGSCPHCLSTALACTLAAARVKATTTFSTSETIHPHTSRTLTRPLANAKERVCLGYNVKAESHDHVNSAI